MLGSTLLDISPPELRLAESLATGGEHAGEFGTMLQHAIADAVSHSDVDAVSGDVSFEMVAVLSVSLVSRVAGVEGQNQNRMNVRTLQEQQGGDTVPLTASDVEEDKAVAEETDLKLNDTDMSAANSNANCGSHAVAVHYSIRYPTLALAAAARDARVVSGRDAEASARYC